MSHHANALRRRSARMLAMGAAAMSAITLGATMLTTGPASASTASVHSLRASAEPWAKAKTVGFIMVGEETDEGYNQAVYTASLKVKKDLGAEPCDADKRSRWSYL